MATQRVHSFEVEVETGAASGLEWVRTGSDESKTAVMGAEGQEDESAGNCSDGVEVEAVQGRQRVTCRCAGWRRFQLAARILQSIPEGRCENGQAVAAAPGHQSKQDANAARRYDRAWVGLSAWAVEPQKVKAEGRAQGRQVGS